ncbi:hypothetical protein EB834_19580 [Brevibacterium aurantiacum]|uniref:Methyltransferase FkbM domain-containing protein n=1 Tax=Brevibacterium aurantiacum TaxID=273384 RepID=A0A4Z0KD55_BREAU|nr:hypothetical protein EB834_19580 [Brevibacterium aurantiacum]
MLTLNITIFPVQEGHFHFTRSLVWLSASVDQGLEKVSLLKIDVERSELDVIRGISADHWPLIERVVA